MWPFPKRTTALFELSDLHLIRRARRAALFLASARYTMVKPDVTPVVREAIRELAGRLERRHEASATMDLLNELRSPIGTSVEIACGGEGALGLERIWVDGFTYTGATLAEALASAIEARRVALAQKDERA